jgi:hypothetical protein
MNLKCSQMEKQLQWRKQLHMFEQPQNLFTNLVLNSYEKSCTHNFHNVFIYNTLFLDPNRFIPLIGFTFISPIFYFMEKYFTSFMILRTTICASVNIKNGLLYTPNFFHLNIKLGKTIIIPLHQNAS